ncbi:3-oxoacyl-(acyl-carrier-protein) reductase FabG [Shimia sp. SK013]|uniref:SDR family NAD(P)-dependent oxidoreductase n=1 Tax=Shimia sp. SK013 TaxID=1389006 RepID=UPI0006B40E65|nr:SDR family NAD(P)-dependent oxidoreductase [Shimia sp. SK013]KPA20779.1 3-oxoacyl-(acyl-carrier-protein) reductase FabG [Shimia sp. SK013]
MTKTILITGATDGIGYETAKLLVSEGHRVLVHGRSAEKLGRVTQDLVVKGYRADLSSFSDTAAFAQAMNADFGTIDVLINNAGVLKTPKAQTADGLDVRFVVNTLTPYLLTCALLDQMPPDGRVVNLSSAAQAPVDLAAMRGQRELSAMEAYAQSKLAITIWSRELAVELPNGPLVVAVNPGSLLASKMVKEGFGVAGNDLSIGAEILRQAALSDTFLGKSGAYFDNDSGRFADPHRDALNTEKSAAVYAEIKALVAQYGG